MTLTSEWSHHLSFIQLTNQITILLFLIPLLLAHPSYRLSSGCWGWGDAARLLFKAWWDHLGLNAWNNFLTKKWSEQHCQPWQWIATRVPAAHRLLQLLLQLQRAQVGTVPPPAHTCSLLSFPLTPKCKDAHDAPARCAHGSVFSQTERSPRQATSKDSFPLV